MSSWQKKVSKFFRGIRREVKKTTFIGKQMVVASKANTLLHRDLQEIGQIVIESIENKTLEWNNSRVHELVASVKKLQMDLESIEGELKRAKSTKRTSNSNHQ